MLFEDEKLDKYIQQIKKRIRWIQTNDQCCSQIFQKKIS